MIDRQYASRFAAASVMLATLSGCTPAQAAPFGKSMFGLMIVFLIVAPIAFYREYRRRKRGG